MKKDKEPQSTRRRDFLKLAGLGTAAGAAAVVAAADPAEATAAPDAKPGYRETEHVKTYYTVARF